MPTESVGETRRGATDTCVAIIYVIGVRVIIVHCIWKSNRIEIEGGIPTYVR